MSRSGYIDDVDSQEAQWALIRWRGAVAASIRGRRGQALLRELRDALDAMPNKTLIADDLVSGDGDYCALGVLGAKRGLQKMNEIDPDDSDRVAGMFGIANALAREIVFENDEGGLFRETPEQRWRRMRAWVDTQLVPPNA